MSDEEEQMSSTSSEESEPGDIKQRKRHHSILHSLYDREINGNRKIFRASYQTVNPNCSILNVVAPTPYLRKFSPDGRYLIAFSCDLTSVEVYDYLGCSEAADILKDYKEDIIDTNEITYGHINHIFERLFKLKYSIKVAPENELLALTCSLFTENGHYAVVGSNALQNEELELTDVYSSNEAIPCTGSYRLEDYTIYLINLRLGHVSHTLQFKVDQIDLKYNDGIYLHNNTLAILSQQHQIIYIYDIIHDHFNLLRKIGQFCHENDHHLLKSVYSFMNSSTYNPCKERSINGLKHKFMAFFFNKAQSKREKLEFYKNFNELLSFRMWKMQLLDENHLLIRYAPESVITQHESSPYLKVSYFMIYDMATNKVLNILENKSDELLKMYENFCDDFRHSFRNREGCIPSSISNSLYSREIYQVAKNMVITQNKRTEELNKLVLRRLPVTSQAFNSSPYLDTTLFRFEEKFVSAMDSLKNQSRQSIEFYSRKSGSLCFSLNTGKITRRIYSLQERMQYVFHPSEPFAISIVKTFHSDIINFHIHKKYMPE